MSISHNYIYIHVYHPSRISPQPHPTPLAHHRAPGGLPVLSSNFSGCLSETRLCIYIDVTFSIRSTLSFPSPPVPSLYLCLHSFPENRFINTVFLDSIYIINIQYLLFSDLLHSVWQALGSTERLHFHFSLSHIGEGNGNPLQCSCLENPRDGEPGGLPSMGSHRFGHDWSDLAAAAAAAVSATSLELTQLFSFL